MMQFSIIYSILWICLLINVNNACNKIQLNNNTQINSQHSPVCLTSSCNRAASRILRNINQNIDPCDNFYQFACGGLISRFINISNDKIEQISLYDELQSKTFLQLKTIIEMPISLNESKPIRLTKQLYNTCMNTTAIENQGFHTLLNLFGLLGGWPVIDGNKWNDSNFNWIELIYKFRELGYSMNYFFKLEVREDEKNNSRYAIHLNHPDFRILYKYIINGRNDSNVKVYYKFMVDIAVMLGANREHAESELEESLNFEIKLANISLSNEHQRNVSFMYNAITLSELIKNYTFIPWKEYINTLISHHLTVDENQLIIIENPHFLSELEKLIATTPNRVLANYAIWKITADSIIYLNKKIREIRLDYLKLMYGINEDKFRYNECLDILKDQFGIGIGALYIRNYSDNNIINEVAEMIYRIKKRFIKILKTVKWMDKKTKQKAKDKITAITTHISHSDELLNDEILENYYRNLEINNNDFLIYFLKLNRFKIDNEMRLLRKPVDKNNGIQLATVVDPNAYYYIMKNKILISASILQSELFQRDRPKYLNYGAIGTIIGHEITHALDDIGSQYDKHGNMFDWWKPTTKKRFLKKTKCIINQYSNYSIESIGIKLNGVDDQGENIADNGGMKIAYLAYTDWLEKNNKFELSLKGLSYNSKQMFWIAAANNLCSVRKSNNMKHIIIASTHSPEEYRIIGAFSNLQEFSEDFHCPNESKMNPINKCTIW